MIYILTGNGKGKTTSALGMGVRAAGAGMKVFMIQFLKTGVSSENKIIKKIKNFQVKSFGRPGFFLPEKELKKNPQLKKLGVKPFSKKDFDLAKNGFELAKKIAKENRSNLLILDEINLAIHSGLISEKKVLDFLRENKGKMDIVLTGRYCPKEIIKIADLVTEMKEKKHYYKKGKKARKGIEF